MDGTGVIKRKIVYLLWKKPDTKPSAAKESPDDLEAIKARMLDMQMEIDILKEIINVLKKAPASIRQLSGTGRRQ